jgi:hypothetical protein
MRLSPGATVGLAFAGGAVLETAATAVLVATQDASFMVTVLLQAVAAVLRLMLAGVLAGVVTIVLAETALGRRVGLREAGRRVLPRLPRLVALTMLVTLLAVLGLVTLGIVSAWVSVLFCLAAPVHAVEGGTVRSALRRSRALVRGAWWRTFGLLLLVQIVTVTLGVVLAVPSLLARTSGAFTTAAGTPTTAGYVITALASLVVITLVTPVQASVLAVLYLDRRVRREALDVSLARASAEERPLVMAHAPAPRPTSTPGRWR